MSEKKESLQWLVVLAFGAVMYLFGLITGTLVP